MSAGHPVIGWPNRTPSRQHFGPTGRAKRSFGTQADAAAFAATQKASERRPLNAYQCRLCLRWHIGRRAAK